MPFFGSRPHELENLVEHMLLFASVPGIHVEDLAEHLVNYEIETRN